MTKPKKGDLKDSKEQRKQLEHELKTVISVVDYIQELKHNPKLQKDFR